MPSWTAEIAVTSDFARSLIEAQSLRTLHALPADEVARHGTGPDTIARLDLARRVPRAREQLGQIAHRGIVTDACRFVTILDAAPIAYVPCTDALVHGDLYARHLLVGGDHSSISPCLDRISSTAAGHDRRVGRAVLDYLPTKSSSPPRSRAGHRAETT